jgi:WD40 repeat protein
MLSGKLPFTGEGTTALIYQHLYEPPRPLIEVAPHVAPVLGVIVDKLLRKSPADRYASAELLATDLNAFLADESLPSGADIVDDEPELDEELTDGEPGRDTTAILAAPKFDLTPQIVIPEPPAEPEAPSEPARWWERIEQRLWKTLREQAPEFAASLQSAEQELDSTVEDLETRDKDLQRLTKKALRLLQELRQQRNDWQTAAERAADDDQLQRAQQHVRELTQQIADQQEQLSAMRLQQAKISATLERLRSQRDTLQARMKVVEASLKLSGWRRRKRAAISALFLVALLGAVAGIWIAWDRPPIWKLLKQSASSAKDVIAPDVVTSLPLAVPEDQVELPRQTLKGTLGSAHAFVFSSDGSRLYGGSHNGHLMMWNLETGRVTQDILFKDDGASTAASIIGLALDPQSGRIVSTTGGVGQNLQIWSPDLENNPATLELPWIESVQLAPDLNRVLVMRHDLKNKARVLDVYNLQQRAVLQTISNHAEAVAYSPAIGTAVFTTGNDGVLHVWSLKDHREIKALPTPAAKLAQGSLAVSSDGKWAAGIAHDGSNAKVQIWNLPNERLRYTLTTRTPKPRALAFQPGTDLLAVATDESAELWDLERERVRKQFQARNIMAIEFSPDGRTLAAACSPAASGQEGSVVLWDAVPDPIVTTGNPRRLQGMGPADLSRDGEHYVSFEETSLVYRRVKDDHEVSRLPVERRPMDVLLSPDSRLVAYDVGIPTDNNWQWIVTALDSGQEVFRGEADSKQFRFAPDSRGAYFRRKEGMIKSDFDRSQETVVVPSSATSNGDLDLAVSPDERYLAIGGWSPSERTSYLAIADLKQSGTLRRLRLDDHYVWSVAFSPAGDTLAAGSKTQITIWNVETGQLEREIAANSGWIQTLTFSPDGRFLASGPKGPRLWSAETGELLIDFAPDGTKAVSNERLAFTPGGRYLLTSGNGEQPGKPVMLLDKAAWVVPNRSN